MSADTNLIRRLREIDQFLQAMAKQVISPVGVRLALEARAATCNTVAELLESSQERSCVWCGCTDSNACAGGCGWAFKHTATLTGVCTQCVGTEMRKANEL